MSLSTPFLGRTAGLEKSGNAPAAVAALTVREPVTMGALLMANPGIVSIGDIAGKLSFIRKKTVVDDFHFAWACGKLSIIAVCPMV